MKTIVGILIGGVLGGVIGYSGILCPSGACPLTASWYSGALLGGIFGLMLSGGCPACAASKSLTRTSHQGGGLKRFEVARRPIGRDGCASCGRWPARCHPEAAEQPFLGSATRLGADRRCGGF